MDVSGPLNPGMWPFRPGYIGSEFPWAPEAAGGPAWGGRLWRSAVSVLGPVPVGALSLRWRWGVSHGARRRSLNSSHRGWLAERVRACVSGRAEHGCVRVVGGWIYLFPESGRSNEFRVTRN